MKLIPESDETEFSIPHSSLSLEKEVEQFRIAQKAQAKIKKAGLPKPEQYTTEDGEPLNPRLSLKLASISNAKLGDLMAAFTASAEYATYATAVADVNRTVALNVLEFVEAKVRLSKTGTVQHKSDKTKVDPRVTAARSDFLEKDAVYTLTQTIQKNYERGLQTISREITRRQTELENHS